MTRCDPRPLSAAIALALSSAVSAQDVTSTPVVPQKQVRAVRVATPPVIDGRMDEAVWQQAEPITDFHQIRPGNQTEPSERTEVYVVYDDDAMYIAARMYDSEPHLIAAPVIRHGQGMGSDDRLVVICTGMPISRSNLTVWRRGKPAAS